MAKPWIGEAEAEAARRPLLSGWVTQGPEVEAFEREFAGFVGADLACAVSSCTAALHLALRAVGVGEGSEVVTASHSFIATANAIRYLGARPVFVEIERYGFNLDPAAVAQAVGPRTAAILCVHQMGMPCDLEAVLAVGRRHGVPVVEDAACAAGSEILWAGAWERVGRPHADVACFSFHPRKLLTTGEGGMITCGREDWDRRFRLWRQHGMAVSDAARHAAQTVTFETYGELGYNYRLSDIQAAVGREQLKRLPDALARRRAQAARYGELLGGIPGVGLPAEPGWARTNWQSYCVTLPEGCDQRGVMQAMLDSGVATRRGVMCAHREAGFAAAAPVRLPRSESAQDRSVILPLFHEMTEAEQDHVAAALSRACQVPARTT